jgi:hypothetical protein
VRENGRIVIMLCAFDGPPRILRLHGRGEVVLADQPRFDELIAQHRFGDPGLPEARRAIVIVHVTRVATACGYGVPLMTYAGARPHMRDWAESKLRACGDDALRAYQRDKNSTSIDDLPALGDADD